MQGGKDQIVVQWIKMLCNACRIAMAMVLLIWTHKPAIVIQNGVATIVLKVNQQ